MYTKDQAIVLAKRSADDASNFYILYTQKRGLQKVKVRGAKKSLSKMAGHLEPPALSDVFIAGGKNINYIAGANLIKRFNLDCLEKYRLQFWLAKIILQLIRENSGDIELWILLNNFYNKLEKINEEKKINLLKNIFLWQLGSALGFKVNLEKCLNCDQLSEKKYLDFEKGGILCEKCKTSNSQKISDEALKLLQQINENNLDNDLEDFKASDEFNDLSRKYWQYRFEIKL